MFGGIPEVLSLEHDHQPLFRRTMFRLLRHLLTDMTRLTIAQDPGEEFAIRGHNTVTAADDDGIIFYKDITRVHVLPERESFTIQVITPDLAVEMDFADAESVREALGLFEARKVLEVDSEAPNSVRITPLSAECAGT
jgi:hypothetical protein